MASATSGSETEGAFKTPKGIKSIPLAALKRTKEFQDSPFVIPPSPLMKRLGCGTSVTIYKYKRQKLGGLAASPWAIKKAKKGHARRSILDRLAEEAKILRSLAHPNIVVFKKFTKTPKGDVCLSMEAFGKGLDDIIYRHRENEMMFKAPQITQVAYSVVNALDYLHNTMKLLHGDLKSGNVLVKGPFDLVKLCDFGVSIFLKDDLSGPRNPKDGYIGSEPWHSMEIKEAGPVTHKADIFAYGLVIWEMLALDVPHVCHMNSTEDLDGSFLSSNTTLMEEDSLTIPDAYYEAVGTRPAMPDYDYPSEYDPAIGTFICCTIEDLTRRPSAHDVCQSLKAILPEFHISKVDGSIQKLSHENKEIITTTSKKSIAEDGGNKPSQYNKTSTTTSLPMMKSIAEESENESKRESVKRKSEENHESRTEDNKTSSSMSEGKDSDQTISQQKTVVKEIAKEKPEDEAQHTVNRESKRPIRPSSTKAKGSSTANSLSTVTGDVNATVETTGRLGNTRNNRKGDSSEPNKDRKQANGENLLTATTTKLRRSSRRLNKGPNKSGVGLGNDVGIGTKTSTDGECVPKKLVKISEANK